MVNIESVNTERFLIEARQHSPPQLPSLIFCRIFGALPLSIFTRSGVSIILLHLVVVLISLRTESKVYIAYDLK